MYGSNRTIGVQNVQMAVFSEHYFKINDLGWIMRLHN